MQSQQHCTQRRAKRLRAHTCSASRSWDMAMCFRDPAMLSRFDNAPPTGYNAHTVCCKSTCVPTRCVLMCASTCIPTRCMPKTAC
eukprot:1159809-Pelagomonas_calceolata.AAC.3